jgi:hypothetical protein
MMKLKKEYIPIEIKKKVWEKCMHQVCNVISQCGTCENLVRIPKSLIQFYNYQNINFNDYNLYGVGEFGHIISEYNGGGITVNNLIIQCKHCNTSLGKNNIEFHPFDIEMLYYDKSEQHDEMDLDNFNTTCACIIKSKNSICKNKPIQNSLYCHVHYKTYDLNV